MSKVRRQRTSPGEMSGVESGATGNLWEDIPVPQELTKADPADIIAFLWRIGRLPANDSA